MRELMRTNDPVVLSLARTLLEDAGVMAIVADTHMSVLEGSIGVFPRRVMVVDDELQAARDILEEAGLGEWLYQDERGTGGND
jgi:hypothetical protein